jgi:hypothetical protein
MVSDSVVKVRSMNSLIEAWRSAVRPSPSRETDDNTASRAAGTLRMSQKATPAAASNKSSS